MFKPFFFTVSLVQAILYDCMIASTMKMREIGFFEDVDVQGCTYESAVHAQPPAVLYQALVSVTKHFNQITGLSTE